jgi:hypothetical protein
MDWRDIIGDDPAIASPRNLCMRSISIIALSVALCLCSVAHADEQLPEISRIMSQQTQLRADITAHAGRFEKMPATKRDEVLSRQNGLFAVLDGKSTYADLSENERIEVFNTLEWIEAAINNEQDDQLVCRRERTLGSTRLNRVCRTQAQMKLDRERAIKDMDSLSRIQTQP